MSCDGGYPTTPLTPTHRRGGDGLIGGGGGGGGAINNARDCLSPLCQLVAYPRYPRVTDWLVSDWLVTEHYLIVNTTNVVSQMRAASWQQL